MRFSKVPGIHEKVPKPASDSLSQSNKAPQKHDHKHGRPTDQEQTIKATKCIESSSQTKVIKCDQDQDQTIKATKCIESSSQTKVIKCDQDQQQTIKATKCIESSLQTKVTKHDQNELQEISDIDTTHEYTSHGSDDDHANHAKSKVTGKAQSKGNNHCLRETDACSIKGEALESKSIMNSPAHDAKAIVSTTKTRDAKNHWDEAILSQKERPSPKQQSTENISEGKEKCAEEFVFFVTAPVNDIVDQKLDELTEEQFAEHVNRILQQTAAFTQQMQEGIDADEEDTKAIDEQREAPKPKVYTFWLQNRCTRVNCQYRHEHLQE